jgi:phage shock protein PspC (stress-responsive transcriptional regulator)
MAYPQAVPQSNQPQAGAGVCGGLARYLNADATLIRVLFVVLACSGAPAL